MVFRRERLAVPGYGIPSTAAEIEDYVSVAIPSPRSPPTIDEEFLPEPANGRQLGLICPPRRYE